MNWTDDVREWSNFIDLHVWLSNFPNTTILSLLYIIASFVDY